MDNDTLIKILNLSIRKLQEENAALEAEVKRLKNDQRRRIEAQLMARGESVYDG